MPSSSKPETTDSKNAANQANSKAQASTKRTTRSDPLSSQPDAVSATPEIGKSPLKRKAAEAAASAIMGSKNALKPTEEPASKSAATKTTVRKDTKSVIEKSPQTTANVGKREKEEQKRVESDREDEEDDDEEEEEEDEEMDEDLNDEDIDDEEGEEEDEEMEEEVVEEGGNVNDLKLKKKRQFYLKEQRIANRALWIKMGKSGAQAATRKNIKKGKDACQRKLWNQGVSVFFTKCLKSFFILCLKFKIWLTKWFFF